MILKAESVFYGLEVNGHVDDAGEFIVEYIKGIDNEFSRTERDTWMLYLTQWINITIDANGESLVISDEHHAGFFPEGAAIRTDQTVRPFVAQAKYMAGNGSDGKAASISGVNAAHDQSHNGMITRFKAKGTQYCGTTAQVKTIWTTCLRSLSQHGIHSQSCLVAQDITTGSMRLLLKIMWNVSLSAKVMQTIWWSEARYPLEMPQL